MKYERKLKHALKSNDVIRLHQIFEEIYNEYNKLVYFVIMRYVNNVEDIKDLVQDTFISFYNNLDHDIQNIKYYLTVSAKNKAINFVNKQNKIVFDEDFIYKAEEVKSINTNYQSIIEEMKKSLNDQEIEIILLHTIYDLTFLDIAQKFNMNLNTTISIYHRAIKKFRKGVDNK